MNRNPEVVAIACGDFAGIGPEVALRALALEWVEDPGRRFVLIGDAGALDREAVRCGVDLGTCAVEVVDPRPRPLGGTLAPMGAESALAALDYLRCGAERCQRGEYAALVTAPVSKQAILRAGIEFTGQTEFLGELTGTPDPLMILLGRDGQRRWLRVALVTTHVPLRKVPEAVTPAAVERTVRQAVSACVRLGIDRPRIAVCGLNPHAGEGGMLGREDVEVIAPVVEAARAAGHEVRGPLSADTVFHQALEGGWDMVVAMYHDQGLPALKLAAFATGVNWTFGLPFPRTSPDHGTAFDLAGRGTADCRSMRSAIQLARQLAGADRPRAGDSLPQEVG